METINLSELLSILSMVSLVANAAGVCAWVRLSIRFTSVEDAVEKLGKSISPPGASAQGFGGSGPLRR